MKTSVRGLAAQSIDAGFLAKLVICERWDRALGIRESDVCSAVRALKSCYAARRPFFVMVDDVCAPWSSIF